MKVFMTRSHKVRTKPSSCKILKVDSDEIQVAYLTLFRRPLKIGKIGLLHRLLTVSVGLAKDDKYCDGMLVAATLCHLFISRK